MKQQDTSRQMVDTSTTELFAIAPTSARSARSDESVEFAEIITNRQSRIDVLSRLSMMAEQSIKAGLDLKDIEQDPTGDEENEPNPFGEVCLTNDLDIDTARDHQPPPTLVTYDDDEEMEQTPPPDSNLIVGPKWIGNIRCFWPDIYGRPRITIGPNWGFTICLASLVAASLHVTLSALINMGQSGVSWPFLFIGSVIILAGIGSFCRTLMGDPGIPNEIYNKRAHPYKRKEILPPENEKGFPLCKECEVYVTRNRQHCDLCDVCIDNPDHHCVFYSKCIGGGNVFYFRLSILLFIINMAYFVFCTIGLSTVL